MPTKPGNAPHARVPPILFVHGNGDSATLCHTTLWRLASSAYPEDRLFVLDSRTLSRDRTSVPQSNRSLTTAPVHLAA